MDHAIGLTCSAILARMNLRLVVSVFGAVCLGVAVLFLTVALLYLVDGGSAWSDLAGVALFPLALGGGALFVASRMGSRSGAGR